MKKIIFIILAVVFAAISCSKESTNESEKGISRPVILSAQGEDKVTKATLSGSSWIWTKDDEVVVYYLRGDAKWNQQMNLKDESANKANGEFQTPDGFEYHDDMCWNVGAIYPKFKNEIVLYNSNYLANVELKSAYDYTAGQVFMPMVANLSTAGVNQPSSMQFKHVASAVKVTLKNVPVGTKSVTLTADKTIAGKCNIYLSAVGTGVLNYPYESESTSVTFNFTALSSVNSEMVFYFPILPVEEPTITISLKNASDEVFWSRTATKQHSLGRGEILDMDELTVPSTKKVNLGIITYIPNTWDDDLKVHYWYGTDSAAGDEAVAQESGTVTQALGNSYWSNGEQTFNKFYANIPITATHFKLHKGDDWDGYDGFGGNKDYSKNRLFIFEYGGTYHYDFH